MDAEKVKKEILKCSKNPEHFISKYTKVVHPKRGLVEFNLYPFQKDILKDWNTHRFTVLRKFRQAGCTTLAAAYSLFYSLFNSHKIIVILSKGEDEALEVVARIRTMYEELPPWLKMPLVKESDHMMKFKNGSIIRSKSSSKHSGRSFSGSILIVDEAAFIDNINTIWGAAYPTLSTGGRAIVLSTVNGIGNWFYETWDNAINGQSSFHPIQIDWKDHPEYFRHKGFDSLYKEMENYDPPVFIDDWEKTTRGNLSPREWAQEYCADFLGAGETYVDVEILKQLKEQENEDFYLKHYNKLRIWKDPLPMYDYVIAADTAMGQNRDRSAFHIFNLYNGEQVAEYYCPNVSINRYADIINEEALRYNTAYVFIERDSLGQALIDHMVNRHEYENVWMDEKKNYGYMMTQRTREHLLTQMEEAIRVGRFKINSGRTVQELLTFIINEKGRAEATEGQHDDLVMSLALAAFAFNQLIGKDHIEFDKGLSVVPPLSPSTTYRYRMNTSYGEVVEEDLRWLLS